jgi:bifunctional non-homologous end joining protein LigD
VTLPAVHPLVPSRSKEVPVGREWVYELKLDGFRGVLHIDDGRARFTSKKSKPMARFDSLAFSLARALPARNAILDGEIIVMGKDGPDFNALFFRRGTPVFCAFDLLWLDGRDLRALPLWRRKKELYKLVYDSPIGYVDHVADPALFTIVSQRDLEGIVAKRRADAYCVESEWIKVKVAGYSQVVGRWELFSERRPRFRPIPPAELPPQSPRSRTPLPVPARS